MLGCRDTFLLPKSTAAIEHLWIVVTDVNENGLALCVSVTSRKSDSDDTVIVKIGEHPFITKESVIYFEDTRWLDLNRVEQLLDQPENKAVCRRERKCTVELLAKIRQGLIRSKYTSRDIKNFCKTAWGTPSLPPSPLRFPVRKT